MRFLRYPFKVRYRHSNDVQAEGHRINSCFLKLKSLRSSWMRGHHCLKHIHFAVGGDTFLNIDIGLGRGIVVYWSNPSYPVSLLGSFSLR